LGAIGLRSARRSAGISLRENHVTSWELADRREIIWGTGEEKMFLGGGEIWKGKGYAIEKRRRGALLVRKRRPRDGKKEKDKTTKDWLRRQRVKEETVTRKRKKQQT